MRMIFWVLHILQRFNYFLLLFCQFINFVVYFIELLLVIILVLNFDTRNNVYNFILVFNWI